MKKIYTLIDETQKILKSVNRKIDVIDDLNKYSSNSLYNRIKKYDNIFSKKDPITTDTQTYNISSLNNSLINLDLFKIDDNIQELEKIKKPENNYLDINFNEIQLKQIINEYSNTSILGLSSLFNTFTFTNKVISFDKISTINSDLLLAKLKSETFDEFEAYVNKLKDEQKKVISDKIKNIKWRHGKTQVNSAISVNTYIEQSKKQILDSINLLSSAKSAKEKTNITHIIVSIIALLMSGKTISFTNTDVQNVGITKFKWSMDIPDNVDLSLLIELFVRPDRIETMRDFLSNSILKISCNGKAIFSGTKRTNLSINEDIKKSHIFKSNKLTKFENLKLLLTQPLFLDGLFNDYYKNIIEQNEEDEERIQKIMPGLQEQQYNILSNMIMYDLFLNMGRVYRNKVNVNRIYTKILTTQTGGSIKYSDNNLLFDKDKMLKYVENLRQLSLLNEVIEKNKKIINKVNQYVAYVQYFKKIIDTIDAPSIGTLNILNLVITSYEFIRETDVKLANKIYVKKSRGRIILLDINEDYIPIINKKSKV